MIPLNEERWKEFEGGYRLKYDVSIPLLQLESGTELDSIWSELWENLYHQGDVGIASYAAIPHVVRITRQREILNFNPFALIGAIELARGQGTNPALPIWLREDYEQSLWHIVRYACAKIDEDWDSSLLKSVLSLIAVIKGNRDLGALILEIDEGYERFALDKYFEG